MGLFDKVKGILFDEEEVEIPVIKKEEKKEEVKTKIKEENPIKEIKMPKDDFSDRENYKSESTFTFPIDFEDEVVKPKPVKREEPKKEYKPIKREVSRDYTSYLRKEEKKFKPTPIISPVYGVLDQNYKKEDVIVKKDVLRKPSELTLDEVRKRAFGSLEEELEQTLTSQAPIIKEERKIKEVIVEEPIDKKKTIGELIDEDDLNIDIPSIETEKKDNTIIGNDVNLEELDNDIDEITSPINKEETENIEDDVIIKEKEDVKADNDDEADLFSLIDSMYEEKGE